VVLDCDNTVARLMFWNGSPLDACGSATRSTADILLRKSKMTSIALRTNRGLLTCERTSTGTIFRQLGATAFGWSDIPLELNLDTAVLPLTGGPTTYSIEKVDGFIFRCNTQTPTPFSKE